MRFGVEPVCEVLPVTPSAYCAARSRPPSARSVPDGQLKPEIDRVHAASYDPPVEDCATLHSFTSAANPGASIWSA